LPFTAPRFAGGWPGLKEPSADRARDRITATAADRLLSAASALRIDGHRGRASGRSLAGVQANGARPAGASFRISPRRALAEADFT
jgi:hypothetical protein